MFKKIFSLGLLALIAIPVAAFLGLQLIIHDLPELDNIANYKPPQVTRVYDIENNLIAELYLEKRTVIDVKSLPKHVKNAFLAAEDANFYHHEGIDYFGLIRAVFNEIKYKLVGGQRIGGSTITQQTAKTMLLSRQRTYTRKIKELILAKRIEDTLTKDDILNLYLNQIYFGHGVYGIEEAAKYYYNVPAKELTMAQSATLAAIPKSPNNINPVDAPARVKDRRAYVLDQMYIHGFATQTQVDLAKKESIEPKVQPNPYLGQAVHFTEVVRRMLIEKLGNDTVYEGGLIVRTTVDAPMQIAGVQALRKGLRELDKRHGYLGPLVRAQNSSEREQIADIIREKREQWFLKKDKDFVWNFANFSLASPSNIRKEKLQNGITIGAVVKSVTPHEAYIDLGSQTATLNIATTKWARAYNPEKYTAAPNSLMQIMKPSDIILVKVNKLLPLEVTLEQTPKVEGALVAIEPHSHEVRALVGGYDFNTSHFIRATQAKRQPGSAIKPILYSLALDRQVVTASSLITDAPKVYNSGSFGQWKPRNYTLKFLGDITLRRCLIGSVNTCSITLLERLGVDTFREQCRAVGLLTDKTPFPRDLTIALGSAEVTPLSLVNAHTIFPNLGQYAPPVFIKKISKLNGEVIFQEDTPISVQVISPQAAYITTTILRDVIQRGTARAARSLPYNLAGKTGTTNDMRSVSFLGYSPDLVAGVYVGFDDNTSVGPTEYAAQNALPIWINFMQQALKYTTYREFSQPEGLVWRRIDEKTGLLASDATAADANKDVIEEVVTTDTPATPTRVINEVFIAGTEPTKSTSDIPPPPLEMIEGL